MEGATSVASLATTVVTLGGEPSLMTGDRECGRRPYWSVWPSVGGSS